MHRLFPTCGLLFILVMTPGAASANIFEMLVKPGPLAEAHAKYENKCEECHVAFTKEAQDGLCRACHKEVDKDIAARVGLHGRNGRVAEVQCSHCHAEHKGREYDIIGLVPETFSHAMTDFPLEGAHSTVSCGRCHLEGRKHREAPSACKDCHKADDPHRGELGPACGDCHDEVRWRAGKFDHRRTKFPLIGRHEKVACKGCHLAESYKSAPTTCVECHRFEDVHAGRLGDKCQSCHTPRDWKSATFDHDRDTKFALTGQHGKITCQACHGARQEKKKPPTDCLACHEKDDEHKGRNGLDCKRCHDTHTWRSTKFDHGKDTRVPLGGKHGELACTDCHRGNVFKEKLAMTCISCHKADDVHRGGQGEACENCHNDRDWGGQVFFDHDLSRFPLIGLHAAAPCEECHLTAVYRDTSRACMACHEADDKHRRRLGKACGLCHNPNGWRLWRFDHGKQTDYRLDGAHVDLVCESCHRKPAEEKVSQSSDCIACHRKDDVHRGDFGRRCERCHETGSFRKTRLP